MAEQLTDWFPGTVQPARPGIYEVAYYRKGKLCSFPFPFHIFDGRRWLAKAAKTPNGFDPKQDGRPGKSTLRALYKSDSVWRGLAHPPGVPGTQNDQQKGGA